MSLRRAIWPRIKLPVTNELGFASLPAPISEVFSNRYRAPSRLPPICPSASVLRCLGRRAASTGPGRGRLPLSKLSA